MERDDKWNLHNCYVCREERVSQVTCYGPFKSYNEADNYLGSLNKLEGFKPTRLTHTIAYFPSFLRRIELMLQHLPTIKIQNPKLTPPDEETN